MFNTASADELVESDHLGRAMAARLACHRDQFGPFERPEDSRQVPGIQKKMVKKLGREMSFDGTRASWTCDLVGRCQGKCRIRPVEVGRLRRLLRCGSAVTEEVIFFPDDEDTAGLSRIMEAD